MPGVCSPISSTRPGDAAGADQARARYIKAATRDPRLMEAAAALVDNQLPVAEAQLRAHLQAHPTDVAALRMLAEVAARLRRYADAQQLLERCLELAPSFDAARHNYATVLNRQGNAAAALLAGRTSAARRSRATPATATCRPRCSRISATTPNPSRCTKRCSRNFRASPRSG